MARLWHDNRSLPVAQRFYDLLTDTIGAVFADGIHDVDSAILNPQLLGFSCHCFIIERSYDYQYAFLVCFLLLVVFSEAIRSAQSGPLTVEDVLP